MFQIAVRFAPALAVLMVAALCAGDAEARVWYVDKYTQTLAPDGESWATAFPTIQQGLDAAFNDLNGEVWVRAGVYDEPRPPAGFGNTGALVLRPGIPLYGGFRGDETVLAQRDPDRNPTIIDGRLALGNRAAVHVVVAANNSLIDGFTIRGGETFATSGLDGSGGGILSPLGISFTVANCVVRDNIAAVGGGIYAQGGFPLIVNTRVTGNTATVAGAGVHLASGANVTMVNAIVDDNIVTGEFAEVASGGGVTCVDGALLTATNCTIWENVAEFGNAVLLANQSQAIFRNSIIWDLEDTDVAVESLSSIQITFSNVQGGFPGSGNINADPRLARPSLGNFQLRLDSPCIDAGTSQNLPALASTDFNGLPRPQRVRIDMGAVELPPVFLVDNQSAKGVLNGLTWDTAFDTIQDGIDAADAAGGGEVWVANGRYDESRAATNADGALVLREGIGVYGGFGAVETYREERRLPEQMERSALRTVIDGSIARNGQPAFHVVIGADDAVLNGFRIEGGLATGTTSVRQQGGGLYSTADGLVLRDCQFIGNEALRGGGAYLAGETLVENCYFAANEASQGGGLYWSSTDFGRFLNCMFAGNAASLTGAGVFVNSGAPWIYHCVVFENTSPQTGGIAAASNVAARVANCIVRGNTSIQTSGNSLAITNSNVQANIGGTNINQPPQFYQDDPPYDFRLREDSLSIDAGGFSRSTPLDARDVQRPRRAAPDQGAYEMLPVVYVDVNADGLLRNGESWDSAFITLQQGIDLAAAIGGGEVWVANGVYGEQRTSTFDEVNTASLVMRPEVDLYGGFQGGEEAESDRDWVQNPTVIDGDTSRGVLPALHVVVGADRAILDGFSVSGGQTLFNGIHASGAGIWNLRASPEVRNCTILNNNAEQRGSGVHNERAEPYFINCVFTGNGVSTADAGAISNDLSRPGFINCTVSRNTGSPGAFENTDSLVRVDNSILWSNGTTSVTNSGSTFLIRYSNVQGGFAGEGNISVDPEFVSPTTRNFRLLPDSPCIDAGSLKSAAYFDYDGRIRPQGVTIDMGAFEAPDADNDGILDEIEGTGDRDNDGVPNFLDDDSDGDGILDRDEGVTDTDDDGTPDFLDFDSDDDGLLDEDEGAGDPDDDGIPNYRDLDSDNDGLSDEEEATVHDTDPYDRDSDNGGVSDGLEVDLGLDPNDPADDVEVFDINGDNVIDAVDIQLVINGALGLPVGNDTDVNGDGNTDAVDVQLIINAVLSGA